MFPPAVFDLAFALPHEVAASVLITAVHEGASGLLETVDVFDVFTGDTIGKGRKSIAVRIRLRATDRTLTDEEVVPVRKAIVERVSEVTGGELRGLA